MLISRLPLSLPVPLLLFESIGVVLANLAAGTVAQPLWNRLATYQQNRILVFLDPEVDPRGAGSQTHPIESCSWKRWIMGKGIHFGFPQKRYDFLPSSTLTFFLVLWGKNSGS
ncbi:MAG: hypothetical protein CM1200mP14_09340 [Gammaproteobacteria bacterium]|nr:MAG: hypothetical protein CM1200mP14_09340 [Gammaproteobacteria bacterium]